MEVEGAGGEVRGERLEVCEVLEDSAEVWGEGGEEWQGEEEDHGGWEDTE